jgi:hypothetical protein
MAVELIDFVDALKREVSPPGSDIFASVRSSEWVGYLSDAFWEARLDGFLAGYQTDEAGVGTDDIEIVPISPELPDLDRRGMALVILYAGVKVLRNRILNMNTQFRAKAGSVEFEQQNSATMLAEMLKQLKATKDRIIEALDTDSTDVVMLDVYSTRVYSAVDSYHGAPELSGGF